ncbi:hypothetical protein ACFL0X_00565 [Nanoarchaeota archaeon]
MNDEKGLICVVGNMFGGKTTRFGCMLSRYTHAEIKTQAFKVSWDDRYSVEDLRTLDGAVFTNVSTMAVPNSKDLIDRVNDDTRVVGIDEIQFFDERIFPWVLEEMRKRLILITGLQLDFRGNPFPLRSIQGRNKDSIVTTGDFMSYASEIIQEFPVCTYKLNGETCGNRAIFIQRHRDDNSLSRYEDPTIVVGGVKNYRPRCLEHFVWPLPNQNS